MVQMTFLFEIELLLAGPWVVFVSVGLFGAFLGHIRWYLAIPAVLIQGFYIFALLIDYWATDVYPYIRDPYYFPVLYAGMAIGLLLPIAGALFRVKRASQD